MKVQTKGHTHTQMDNKKVYVLHINLSGTPTATPAHTALYLFPAFTKITFPKKSFIFLVYSKIAHHQMSSQRDHFENNKRLFNRLPDANDLVLSNRYSNMTKL